MTQETPREQWRADRRSVLRNGAILHEFLRKLNGAGEHLLVVEIGEAALKEGDFTDTAPILQQMGRALSVLGSNDEARLILERIGIGRADDAETLGLLGRVWKALAEAAMEAGEKESFLRESLRHYEEGFRRALAAGDRGGGSYCGINASALATLLGDLPTARELAVRTLEQSRVARDYYGLATRAEAQLILGQESEAAALYSKAAAIAAADNRWADLASTHKQCRALSLKLHGRRDRMDGSFPSGAVAAISTEPLQPDVGELDPYLVDGVRERVLKWVRSCEVRCVFSGALPGWDLLVLQTMQQAGVETHLVLPCEIEPFLELVVRPKGLLWEDRFEEIRAGAVSITILREVSLANRAKVKEFTERMIAARGSLLASHLGFSRRVLVVGDEPANTAAGEWGRMNLAPYVIYPGHPDLDGVPDKDAAFDPVPFARALKSDSIKPEVTFCAIVLLRFPEYGEMKEDDFCCFQSEVLGTIAARLALADCPSFNRQGFGASYLFVFDRLSTAATIAVDVLKALQQLGQEPGVSIHLPSICLHAGLAWKMVNPVLNLYAYEGAAITRADALATRVPAGIVYATETFAALSALESIRGFRFEHAGLTEVDGCHDRLFRIYPV